LVKIPYSNLVVPGSQAEYYLAMLNKGNVLQYKANSSNLTKQQKYSLIAKGQWVNRNTTWAIQSTRGYTNPNTTSLKRDGNFINIAIDPTSGEILGPTLLPVTCPQFNLPDNPGLPINSGGGINNPVVPPPPPDIPTNNDTVIPPVTPVTPPTPIVIQDGGTLICSIQENICTGETIQHISQQICNPTTDSDVPGTIQELCWNDGTPTWYPRQRYVMTNSGDKWPTNYKLLVSADIVCPIPVPPVPPVPPTPIVLPTPILESVIPSIYSLLAMWNSGTDNVEINNSIIGYIINTVEYDAPIDIFITTTETSITVEWLPPPVDNIDEIAGYIITITEYS